MSSNKRILELCLSPDIGGLELFMISCFKAFKQKASCHIVLAPYKKLDKYLENEEKFYIKRSKFFPILPALKLARYIDKNSIDIIHFHWTKDINIAVLAKIFSKRRPKIIQTRNMTMTRFKDDFYHKWLYSHIDTIHSVTYQVKEQIQKFIPPSVCPKVEMIYMGVEANSIDNMTLEEFRKKYSINYEFIVGIVGRIEDAKGQYIVIEAISKLKDLNIKVMIVGLPMETSYLDRLKQKIEDFGIEEKVIFTGFTKDVDEHMQLFDVNILATQKETFGLVVVEAMMNKICVIATNSGGPLEIIEDGKDGLLFDRSSEDLAAKIELLYHDLKYRDHLASMGYQKAKLRFNKAKQLDKLYDTLVDM
jgi:glycosyltransferase involved in cell wall biosynthesis